MSAKKTFIPHWAYYTAVSKRDKHDVEVPDNFFTGGNILVKKVTFKKEQLMLLVDGAEVLEAPGLGKVNDVIKAAARIRAGNTPYDTDTISLWYSSLTAIANPIVTVNGIINSSVDKIVYLIAAGTDVAENDAVILKLDGEAPTEGDGEIDVYIIYRIITL